MRFERDRHGLAAGGASPSNDFTQNLRVGPVHAIKIPHADKRGPVAGGNLIECMKNLHRLNELSSSPTPRVESFLHGPLFLRGPAAWAQISNSSFIPSYERRTCFGRVAFVTSCPRS